MLEQSNSTPEIDERWCLYIERFSSTPQYYFSKESGLEYPEDTNHPFQQIQKLEGEIESIERQIVERESETKTCEKSEVANREFDLEVWKVRALRAQRMKSSQVRILQAWCLDHVPCLEERVSLLEAEVSALKRLVLPKT